MKLIIVYPIPFDAFTTFKPYVERFAKTFKAHHPGVEDYEVWAMCCMGKATPQIHEMFWDIKTRFIDYMDHGCDIGSQQYAAQIVKGDALIVGMTSRCFFHRPGWGKRYLEARERHGKGLYGVSVSKEGGTLHICTRGHAMDADLWRKYPHVINTRGKGLFFEVGQWCVTTWVREQQLPTIQVTWDTTRDISDAHHPDEKAIFRRGSQVAMLVHDKHSQIYEHADPEEKQRLAELCFGRQNI